MAVNAVPSLRHLAHVQATPGHSSVIVCLLAASIFGIVTKPIDPSVCLAMSLQGFYPNSKSTAIDAANVERTSCQVDIQTQGAVYQDWVLTQHRELLNRIQKQ